MGLLICFLSRKVFNILAAVFSGITASFKATAHKKGASTLLRLPPALSSEIRLSFNSLHNLRVILGSVVARVQLQS